MRIYINDTPVLLTQTDIDYDTVEWVIMEQGIEGSFPFNFYCPELGLDEEITVIELYQFLDKAGQFTPKELKQLFSRGVFYSSVQMFLATDMEFIHEIEIF